MAKSIEFRISRRDSAGNWGDLPAALEAEEMSEATSRRWRNQHGGLKAEQAKRLNTRDDENRQLKEIEAKQLREI
ncbi:MAG: hypothetical protein KDA63_04000 [Planctomycetales bacterium]|nr:hypothetical protein [Planctomycetales bacterium]